MSVAARRRQKGAALLIVLLLVATLSFIALAATERTALSAARSVNERIRAESLWYAFGAEALALTAIEAAHEASDGKMSLDDPWATTPLNAPIEEGTALLYFADDTACFNVNSLAREINDDADSNDQPVRPAEEFALLVRNLGFSEFEGETLAEVIGDWVDEDTRRRPQGAEDGFYGGLPSPYRTGNTPVAAVSELRAMKGVARETYAALKPYLCAHPDAEPSTINVNMLAADDAPLLAAALDAMSPERTVTVQAAADIIAARPPGGYSDTAAFLVESSVQSLGLERMTAGRFDITSKYMRARAEIIYDSAVFEMTVQLALDTNGRGTVLMRRFGAEE